MLLRIKGSLQQLKIAYCPFQRALSSPTHPTLGIMMHAVYVISGLLLTLVETIATLVLESDEEPTQAAESYR